MLGVNVATCLAGQPLCRSPQPFSPACASPLQSLSANQTGRMPAARAGLSLACEDLPSPVSPQQGYCSRPDTSLAPVRRLRARSVTCSQPRPFPVRGCSSRITRCSRPSNRPSHPFLSSLPFGTFIPPDQPSLRSALAPGGNAYEEACREATPDLPSLPASEFFRLHRRIIVPGPLRSLRLAVPRASWNHLQCRSDAGESQKKNAFFTGLLSS